ncbi:MAG: hypothetical protein SCK29_10450 [Bacillota bacterium]|nr:hypothetical protein [Bacillota bacterium]MDW7684521.1 hypothetical protein [Bacillota bacterium]
MREKLTVKTANLLNKVLVHVPTRTALLVNDMPLKVICGSDGRKSLLINNRPLSTLEDCEWVIENFEALMQTVDAVMNPEAEQSLKVIEKTKELMNKVDELAASHISETR